MREADFKNLTGWVDIDRPLLATLSKSQEIRYFRARIKRTVIAPLRRMVAGIRQGTKAENPLLCFGTCLCCAIEALGKFQTGKLPRGNSGSNFRAFVQTYMDPRWNTEQFAGRAYVDHLWNAFRNGLAHGFVVKQGGFALGRTYFRIHSTAGVSQLEICPSRLLSDFTRGISGFVKRLSSSPRTSLDYKHFHAAFDGLYIQGL